MFPGGGQRGSGPSPPLVRTYVYSKVIVAEVAEQRAQGSRHGHAVGFRERVLVQVKWCVTRWSRLLH